MSVVSQLLEERAARLLDLVTYIEHPVGGFLLCRTCRIAIPTKLLPFHFSRTSNHAYNTKDLCDLLSAWEAVYEETLALRIHTEPDATAWRHRLVQASTLPPPPIPELPIHQVLQCSLDDPVTGRRCVFLHGYIKSMRAHCYNVHGWGLQPKQGHRIVLKEGEKLPWEENVPAQRLREKGQANGLWRVSLQHAHIGNGSCLQAESSSSAKPAANQTWVDLEARLARARQRKTLYQAATSQRYPVHVSPWIEKTGWATYLEGYPLHTVAQLLDPPSATEPGLSTLHRAFDVVVEAARAQVLEEDKINPFMLHRVNSFVAGRSYKRPLHTKLVDGTYRKYKAVWRKLLSFVYRLTVLQQGPDLHYQLTPQQQQALAQLPPSITAGLSAEAPTNRSTKSAGQASSACFTPPQPSSLPSVGLQSLDLDRRPQQQHQYHSALPSFCQEHQEKNGNPGSNSSDCSVSEYNPSPSLSAAQSIEEEDSPECQILPSIQLGPDLEPAGSVTEPERTACLLLCISLLDHKIQGRLTDSITVAFLAVNGINKENTGFEEAVTATSDLSALVKIAQLLVLHFAIYEHQAGRADFPSDKVAELQDRFMVFGSSSPINWILNLRAYGAVIRNNTTAAGWIEWSDDGQKLTYKALELTLIDLRWAVRDQITLVQEQLSWLLLLPDSEPDTRSRLVPEVSLAQLKDDPGVFTNNYCFLLDPRNTAALVVDGSSYMLNRIRDAPKLRKRFLLCEDTLTWNLAALQDYVRFTYQFLERLLLLIHMTGGQPARGTELLTLRWRNSTHGDIRSIFVDNGMLAFVTSYHKNYSTSSTAKIIHRYLPSEVGELLLYYLWLITPFLDNLHILTEEQPWQSPNIGSYLWPESISAATNGRKIRIIGKGKKQSFSGVAGTSGTIKHRKASIGQQEQPWSSLHLGVVFKKLLAVMLSTTVTVLLWRHAAIAMSRKHLPEGLQFKRDYSMNEGDAIMDLQSTHTSKRAALSYARSRDEGPGFSKMIRDDYRCLSRAWHTFLGFGTVLPPRDSVQVPQAPEIAASAVVEPKKREREELERELKGWVRGDRLLRLKRRNTHYTNYN